jgi:hypothetical protein
MKKGFHRLWRLRNDVGRASCGRSPTKPVDYLHSYYGRANNPEPQNWILAIYHGISKASYYHVVKIFSEDGSPGIRSPGIEKGKQWLTGKSSRILRGMTSRPVISVTRLFSGLLYSFFFNQSRTAGFRQTVNMRLPIGRWSNSTRQSRISLAITTLACAGIFLAIFGAKLLVISQFTMPHPYWDSWHVEGLEVYKPFLSGQYHFLDLFAPASEHRPAVLRLYGLALLILDRQWDVQLQMVGTAALFGVFGCLLFIFVRGSLPAISSFWVASGIALVLSLPAGWENTVNGHHAGWFFFYISAILAIWFCVGEEPLLWRWWMGFGAVVVGYLSLFAGIITPFAAAGGMLYRLIRERRNVLRTCIGIVILLAVFVAGMAWENRFPGQANVKARDLPSFIKALGYALIWPKDEITAPAFFVWAPLIVAMFLLATRRWETNRAVIFILVLAFWVLLQSIGMGYARGMTGIPPVPRYRDMLCIGVLINFVLLVMIVQSPFSKRVSIIVGVLSVVWIWSNGSSLDARTDDTFQFALPGKAQDSFIQDALLRAYVGTHDKQFLDNKTAAEIAYYGGPDTVASILDDSILRPVLPYSIREPLHIEWPQNISPFRIDGTPPGFPELRDHSVIGSYDASGVTGTIESNTFPVPTMPYLEIRVAGTVGKDRTALQLVSSRGERIGVVPGQPSDRRWISVVVPSPTAPFRIVAVDSSAPAWLAFSPPREVGRLSAWARMLLDHGAAIYGVGLACLVATLALAILASVDQIAGTRLL